MKLDRRRRPPVDDARVRAARKRAEARAKPRGPQSQPHTMTPLDGWVLEQLERRVV